MEPQNPNGFLRAADFYRVLRDQDKEWDRRLDDKLGDTEGRLVNRIGALESKLDRYMEQASTNRRGEWAVAISIIGIALSVLVGCSSVLLVIVKLGITP